ncbi:pilus assembly protein PilP [Massilia sp. TWP1-3-3]|uniref:pilus assembly protein PilP n=1 Tax=Massilia sp. TWP1-3-3 TaxID=2804573 RepID=UPI003CE893BC
MTTLRHALALLLGGALLAGCGGSDEAEINTWMAGVKAGTKISVEPISEPKTFIPFAYGVRDEIEPFDANKLLAELARSANAIPNPLKPDTERRKEYLETFPLDGMVMVGTINKAGVNYGLIQIDRAVHQVKKGQKLGQNFGVVTGVADSAINVAERVQDAGGEWVERMTKLELQESKETKK